MKDLYIFILCLFVAGSSFGQQNTTNKRNQLNLRNNNTNDISYNQLKADGDIFWTETFDWANPNDVKGWTLPDGWELGEEGEDLGHLWMWRDDTIGGNYTEIAPRTWFETEENGFIVLPMDEYNSVDGVETFNVCDSWFQTAAIDCSDKTSVIIKLNQYFRTCCANTYSQVLQVTNDDGAHWSEFDLELATGGNNYTLDAAKRVEINISDVAAGKAEVKLRVLWMGSDSYFWIIDDMTLSEGYHNELKLENNWAFMNNNDPEDEEGFINYIPLSQISETFGGYSFRSAVINSSIDAQTGVHLNVDVLKNGQSVYNENSPYIDMNSLIQDTLNITENEFLADDYGDYLIRFDNLMDNDDQIPDNNIDNLSFTVTDSLYMRSDKSAESGFSTQRYVGGGNTNDIIGNLITITTAVEASSISAYIYGFGANSESTENTVQFLIMRKDIEGDEEWIEQISSETFELDIDEEDYWLTLNFEKDGETEFLVPGDYLIACRVFGDGEGEHFEQDIRLGHDLSTYCPELKGKTYFALSDSWFDNEGNVKLIGLNTVERGGPTIAPVTFNVDLNEEIEASLFNPAADFIDVTGTFNDWGASEAFTDADGDGIYTLTVPDLSTGENIEYKYRINANIVIPEVDNRTYQVRYWNVIDNSFIFDSSIGIKKQDIVNSLSVYPNPTTGMINVVVNNSKQSNLTIEMRDIQGQLVYSNKVNSVLNHREAIDINLAKGMYFLSVNNGNDINVKKVIVQ